jgi:hypothetical protein
VGLGSTCQSRASAVAWESGRSESDDLPLKKPMPLLGCPELGYGGLNGLGIRGALVKRQHLLRATRLHRNRDRQAARTHNRDHQPPPTHCRLRRQPFLRGRRGGSRKGWIRSFIWSWGAPCPSHLGTWAGWPPCSRRQPVQNDSISTAPSIPVA